MVAPPPQRGERNRKLAMHSFASISVCEPLMGLMGEEEGEGEESVLKVQLKSAPISIGGHV